MAAATTGPLTFSTIEPEAGLKAALAKPRADIIAEVTARASAAAAAPASRPA